MTQSDFDRMVWRTSDLANGVAHYGVGGSGRPVLFLHGWGLSGRTYGSALRRLAAAGNRVFAPSLPGFGGTAPLPSGAATITTYARWLGEFIRSVGIDEPLTVVGHSFGGGLAIRLAHDEPELVTRLLLVNSIGGAVWRDSAGMTRPMRERPLWDWAAQLRHELGLSLRAAFVAPRIVREVMPSVVRNPVAVWRAATAARCADLSAELGVLRRRRLPVTILWSDQDTVVPQCSFIALRSELAHAQCVVVPGKHGWLIDDGHQFAAVVDDVLTQVPSYQRCGS